ncbi:hypothetical protein CDIK_4021 [Cucumispora dikerogammari]|nr:hypothetical protein CDIK_4021 [Cucumispora dikerogammari]
MIIPNIRTHISFHMPEHILNTLPTTSDTIYLCQPVEFEITTSDNPCVYLNSNEQSLNPGGTIAVTTTPGYPFLIPLFSIQKNKISENNFDSEKLSDCGARQSTIFNIKMIGNNFLENFELIYSGVVLDITDIDSNNTQFFLDTDTSNTGWVVFLRLVFNLSDKSSILFQKSFREVDKFQLSFSLSSKNILKDFSSKVQDTEKYSFEIPADFPDKINFRIKKTEGENLTLLDSNIDCKQPIAEPIEELKKVDSSGNEYREGSSDQNKYNRLRNEDAEQGYGVDSSRVSLCCDSNPVKESLAKCQRHWVSQYVLWFFGLGSLAVVAIVVLILTLNCAGSNFKTCMDNL